VFALLVAACSSPKDAPLAISTARSAPPDPTFSRQDPVEATLGFSFALTKAEQRLDEHYPGLASYGQGPALADIVAHVRTFKSQGLRLGRPRVVTNAGVAEIGTVEGKPIARVTSCVTEPADSFVDAKTGKPRPVAGESAQPANYHMWTAYVVHMTDGWHVDHGSFTPVSAC